MVRKRLAVVVFGMVVHSACLRADVLVLGDFEKRAWPGLVRTQEQVKGGKFAGKWANLSKHPRINAPNVPKNWTSYDRLQFWLYSEKANGQRLTLVCDSDNKADNAGWDYYYYHFRVDWQGWKRFDLRLGVYVKPTRKPLGWHRINYLSINAAGWENKPLPDTVLYFDDVRLLGGDAELKVLTRRASRLAEGGLRIDYRLQVMNRSQKPRTFALESVGDTTAFRLVGLPGGSPALAPGEAAELRVQMVADADGLAKVTPLAREEIVVKVKAQDPSMPAAQVTLAGVASLPRREHPFLFATKETFARAKKRAAKFPWAKQQVERIVRSADAALATPLKVPAEAGQWSHHYVCKKCSGRLRFDGTQHVCQKCGATYHGWPYDQVVYGQQHGRNLRDAKTLGLAYALTGKEPYAQRARDILVAYGEKYRSYPIHDVRGRKSRSGARLFAQTLDEATTIIGVAWAYDLIYNSPCLSDEDRRKIEDGFLREAAKVIKRHNAGISNWQSWHNAGIAAVGFCLQDEDLASDALYGRSGLRFQLDHSVLPDGFWYEGTPAYHYYALMAIRWTAEAAHFAGIDFYRDPALKSLFDAPLEYVFPDFEFPAVNDSDVFSIRRWHWFYEVAYARMRDPKYLAIAQVGRRNSLDALLWGVDALPPAPKLALKSKVFQGLGAAVLRQGSGEEQLYVHLDYGPHGGGHGHRDKLAVILFGLGKQLAPDPGRLAYAAPLQRTWYKHTFAHNTVCVDGKDQRATTGKLAFFSAQPGLAVAVAECGSAYPGVVMQRTLALTDSYLIDVFRVAGKRAHTYDWVWHNYGELRPGMATEPRKRALGKSSGYPHMTGISSAATDASWRADFVQPGANVRVTMLGQPSTQLYFGMGIGNKMRPCPMIVVRRETQATTFVSVIEPFRDEPLVTGLRPLEVAGDDEAFAIEIQRGESRDVFMLAPASGVVRRVAGIETDARACFLRLHPGGPEIRELR